MVKTIQGYDVGNQVIISMEEYWKGYRLKARKISFHGEALNFDRGVTQRYPLTHTIFNVVTDTVSQYWIIEVFGI